MSLVVCGDLASYGLLNDTECVGNTTERFSDQIADRFRDCDIPSLPFAAYVGNLRYRIRFPFYRFHGGRIEFYGPSIYGECLE